jgi:hypothetical protein
MNSVNNLNDLRNAAVSSVSYYVLGHSAPGDGGGGVFNYISTQGGADNNGTIITSTTTSTGRWVRSFEGDVNIRWFGAKGNSTTDDTAAINAAIAFSTTLPAPVYVPTGVYRITQTIVTGNFRGFIGDGKTSSSFFANPTTSTPLAIALDVRGMDRGVLKDFRVDCNQKANVGINTDYGTGGGSLNNSYSNIFIENYKTTGWQANDNNDCYFERIAIPYSSGSEASLKSIAPGGPLQFLNCNFLNHVYVASQNTSFVDCVTGGIIVYGAGFNVIKYEGGYAFPSVANNSVIFIAGDGNGTLPTEAGPITFSGSHIEVSANQYLIGGTGRLHYGVNATGCHLQSLSAAAASGGIISPTVTSVYYPAATNVFTNCWFWKVNTALTNGGFTNQYVNCYVDSYYFNEPNYLKLTGGDVKNVLGLPGIGEDSLSRANNRFINGNGDNASYNLNNMYLRGHWGLGLQGPDGTVNGFIDFRLGKIDLKDGFYINKQKLVSLITDASGHGNINGLAQYPDNASAVNILGTGKLYHTSGTVKITY